MLATATVSKWGNSQGIRFTRQFLKDIKIDVGDSFNIHTMDGKIVLEPVRKKPNIKELVKDMPENYNSKEIFNNHTGNEIW